MSSGRVSRRKHIRVTPQLLSLLTIQRIETYIATLPAEPSNWWFAIQDFDLALTAQMIAFLSGTMQLGALKKGHQTQMQSYLNQHTAHPTDKKGNQLKCEISPFSELLERSMDPKFGFINNSQNPLVLTSPQERDILKLHDFRNDLAHVQPVDWHVQISGLPRMALACNYAIDHLFSHTSTRVHLSVAQINKNQKNLKRISKLLHTAFK